MKFCDIRATVLLQSYVIMPGGRLPETENKRICQISGPKSGRGRLRNLRSGRLRESFWNSVWNKQNGYLKSGRLWKVVAMRVVSCLGKRKIVVRELVMRHLPPLPWPPPSSSYSKTSVFVRPRVNEKPAF